MPPKPPPKKITSIKQIDITKLDVKDLQNIDYEKLLGDVRKKPDTAISFLAPLVAVFISLNIFYSFQTEQRKLSSKLSELRQKDSLVTDFTQAQADFERFVADLPKPINENDFINLITDTAVKHNVFIESFNPGRTIIDTSHETSTLSFVASAPNYGNIGRFIRDLENTGFAIRVNNWSGTRGSLSAGASQRITQNPNDDGFVINFRFEVSHITFKI